MKRTSTYNLPELRDNVAERTRQAMGSEALADSRPLGELSPEERANLAACSDEILSTASAILQRTSSMLRGITQGEYVVMRFLASCGDEAPTAVTIADSVRLTRPRITQIVNSLESKGYAVRKPDATDGRKMHVQITDDGRAEVARNLAVGGGLADAFFMRLGLEDCRELNRLLARIDELMNDYDSPAIHRLLDEAR